MFIDGAFGQYECVALFAYLACNWIVAALGIAFRSPMDSLNSERNVLPVAEHLKIRAPIIEQCLIIDKILAEVPLPIIVVLFLLWLTW